ncbi:RNA-binding protein [Aulosira sp. FACHB-615]|uniref:RNA recognition motif domain-containing protein n=1 Tax=Aulosira sp. FACHB-615 TaxID=2692777 RepID=UPI001686E516|nr:RNA-binding protein [Aulosira sp. FACHB-615]MBD2492299.1 RNA-binding protein [Aulosira sp. FACHB-615]
MLRVRNLPVHITEDDIVQIFWEYVKIKIDKNYVVKIERIENEKSFAIAWVKLDENNEEIAKDKLHGKRLDPKWGANKPLEVDITWGDGIMPDQPEAEPIKPPIEDKQNGDKKRKSP